MAIKFYESPFHAIEEPETASKSVIKADLMILIRDIIKSKKWTQSEAAKRLAVTQPRISDLINGKMNKFTLDMLFSMLDKLEYRTKFTMNNLHTASIQIQAKTLIQST